MVRMSALLGRVNFVWTANVYHVDYSILYTPTYVHTYMPTYCMYILRSTYSTYVHASMRCLQYCIFRNYTYSMHCITVYSTSISNSDICHTTPYKTVGSTVVVTFSLLGSFFSPDLPPLQRAMLSDMQTAVHILHMSTCTTGTLPLLGKGMGER